LESIKEMKEKRVSKNNNRKQKNTLADQLDHIPEQHGIAELKILQI